MSTTVYKILFEKAQAYMLYRYPIIISQSLFVLLGDVDIYLSPELYATNKSFLKHFRETGVVNVTPKMLNHFRNYLNDQKYSV